MARVVTVRGIGQQLLGEETLLTEWACTGLDTTPTAVTTGDDHTVRMWNLRTGEAAGLMAVPSPSAVAFSAAGDLVLGMGHDVAVFRRGTARTPP